jgi:fructokinase
VGSVQGSIGVIGEALIDLVESPTTPAAYHARPGGAAANLAVGLARLGVPTYLACGLGDDTFADLLRDRLLQAGVDFPPHPRRRPTALAVVDHAQAAPRYSFYLAETAVFDIEASAEALARVDAVCVGGLAAVVEPAASLVHGAARRAAERQVLVVDANVRPTLPADADAYRARLEALIELAQIVKLSEDDLLWLRPGASVGDSCERMVRGGALVVLTRGTSGATAYLPSGESVTVPAVPVEVVDTVGAGDAFLSGFLAWLADDGQLTPAAVRALAPAPAADALRLATRAAAVACQRAGSQPPDRAELPPDLFPPGRRLADPAGSGMSGHA